MSNTSSAARSSHVLLLGVRLDGTVRPTPVIAEIESDGRTVLSHRPLDGIEPPATTPLRALLDLDTDPPSILTLGTGRHL